MKNKCLMCGERIPDCNCINIEEAKKGFKYDVYGLKNFLTDTEKEIWQEAIDTVLNELEKKDKVIDEMAKYIVPLDVDEDICKDIERCTDENNNPYKLCKACIKEYFYKNAQK